MMDPETYLRVAAALALVIVLVLGTGMLLRRYAGGHVATGTRGRGPARLAVVESRMLDGRHRLVLIRRDAVEHLILLGPQTPVVVETGIASPASPADGSPAVPQA